MSGRNDILTRWSIGGGSWYWHGPREAQGREASGRAGRRGMVLDYGIPPERRPADTGWKACGDYGRYREAERREFGGEPGLRPGDLGPLPSFGPIDKDLTIGLGYGGGEYGPGTSHGRPEYGTSSHSWAESDSGITVNDNPFGPHPTGPPVPDSAAVTATAAATQPRAAADDSGDDLAAMTDRLSQMQRELSQGADRKQPAPVQHHAP